MIDAPTRRNRNRSTAARQRPNRGRPHERLADRRTTRPSPDQPSTQLRRRSTPYDYAGQDPINNYDLDGQCWTGLCWAKHGAEAVYNGAVKPVAHVVDSTSKTVARYTPSGGKQWAQVYSITETIAATAVAAGATVVTVVIVCPAATVVGGPVGAAGCVVAAAGTAALTAGGAYAAVKEAKAYVAEKRRRHR